MTAVNAFQTACNHGNESQTLHDTLLRQKRPLQQPTECNTSPERVKQAHICSNSHQAQLCIPQPAKQNQTNWWLLKQYGLCTI